MEPSGNLGDAQRGLAQEEGCLHKQQLVDVIDDGTAAGHLTHNAREVGGGDAEAVGIEAYVVVLSKVPGQQTEETEEDFLDAPGETVLADAVLLHGGEVGEEEVVEHAQAVVCQREPHLLIVNHHLHQFAQAAKIIGVQLQAMREFGAPVNAGKIAEITGIDRKEVDKAFAELKKEGAIVSPVRCKWEPTK